MASQNAIYNIWNEAGRNFSAISPSEPIELDARISVTGTAMYPHWLWYKFIAPNSDTLELHFVKIDLFNWPHFLLIQLKDIKINVMSLSYSWTTYYPILTQLRISKP